MVSAEDTVVEDLEARGFKCRKFSKRELRQGKTPDRRVFRDGQFAFFLEIKEIAEDRWVGGGRPDPIFNRLTDDIHQAVQQFDAVNADRQVPNVLALVNNDAACGSLDLIGVITGHLRLEGGGWVPIYMNCSEGRIRDEKHRVDLYLWYDAKKANQMFFSSFDRRRMDRVSALFGVNSDSIPQLAPSGGWTRRQPRGL